MITRPARAPAALAALVLLCLLPAAASAKPIVPGATPLWMESASTSGLPTSCPQAGTLDGSSWIAIAKEQGKPSTRARRLFGLLLVAGLQPGPIVFSCDPDRLGARQFLGPITGDSALETLDEAFWGQRAIVGGALDGGASGLRPGDHVALPAGGARTTTDVTVAAGTATTTVRLPQVGGAPATAARVAGTVAAPQLVLTGADGSETTTDLTVPAPERFKLRLRRTGRTLTAKVDAPADTIVQLLTSSKHASFDFPGGVVSASGHLTASEPKVPRKSSKAWVFAYQPRTRSAWAVQCTTKSGAQPKCGKASKHLDLLLQAILGDFAPSNSSSARARANHAAIARAARAAALAPATVTQIAKDTATTYDISVVPGDLNGDNRPDAWTRSYGTTSSSALIVSNASGGWSKVKLRTTDPNFEGPLLSDIDGDGRADLLSDNAVIVTNAFAGATLPTTVDLRKQRQPSDRDLLPGESDLLSNLDAMPSGSLSDVTGDGRAEPFFSGSVIGTLPSEALPYGRLSQRAAIVPTADFTAHELDAALADEETGVDVGDVGDDRNSVSLARISISTLDLNGHLFTVAPQNRGTVDKTARPIVLQERRADGSVVATRTFSGAGWPILLDVDLASGDALVRLLPTKTCRDPSFKASLRGKQNQCKEQIVRVNAGGAITASVSIERSSDQVPLAVFTGDGPDADASPEALVALTSGLNPGVLGLLPSAATGTQPLDGLAQVDLGKVRRNDLIQNLSVAVMPNGSRWPIVRTTAVTSSESDMRPGELLIVQPQ